MLKLALWQINVFVWLLYQLRFKTSNLSLRFPAIKLKNNLPKFYLSRLLLLELLHSVSLLLLFRGATRGDKASPTLF